MSDLHHLLLAESERLRPVAAPEFETLAGRARRRHTLRLLTLATVVVALAVGTTGVVLGRARSDGRPSIVSAGPLVSSGDCAGLTVTAELVGRPGQWPIKAGNQSTPITMPANYLLWLRAAGPCVQRLRIRVSNDLIQTATGGTTTFNDQGIGVIVSHGNAGAATVNLALSCHDSPLCPETELAIIPITVTDEASTPNPSSTATPTTSPTSSSADLRPPNVA